MKRAELRWEVIQVRIMVSCEARVHQDVERGIENRWMQAVIGKAVDEEQ